MTHTRPKIWQLGGLTLCLIVPTLSLHAEEATLPDAVTRVNSLFSTDEEFEKYVSAVTIGAAIDDLDAGSMMDQAARLSKAERQFQRDHRSGLTAVDLYQKAVETAVETGNTAVLEEFPDAVKQNPDLDDTVKKQLLRLASFARQANAPSRALDAAFSVDIESYSIEGFLYVRQVMDQLNYAKLTGDRASLDQVEADVAQATFLPDEQRASIRKSIEQVRRRLEDSPPNAVLGQLAAASRGAPSARSQLQDEAEMVTAQAGMVKSYSELVKVHGDNLKTEAEVAQMYEDLKSAKLDTKKKKAELYFYLRKLRKDAYREERR